MIGGPTDVVVEPNIVRAVAAPRDVGATRPTAGLDALPRALPLPENGNGSWPLQPDSTGGSRPAARGESSTEEPAAWSLPPNNETTPRPQRDTLSALADELSARPTPPRKSPPTIGRPQPSEPRTETKSEPRVPTPPVTPAQPAATPPASVEADQSLAEMAHRLEAALRKPGAAADARPTGAPLRPEPAPQTEATPATPPRAARPSEPKPRPETKPNQSKALYDSLEQEMASLLGRPTKN
jgi:flagellar protein FliO/FliZ